MERIYQYTVMFLGFLFGTMLFYAGFRRLFRKEESLRGRSLFVLVIAFTLAMMGTQPVSGQEQAPGQQQKTSQPETPKTFKEKLNLLQKTGEWKTLKVLWQKLDEIDTTREREKFAPGIDTKLYRKLAAELEEARKGTDALASKGLLSKDVSVSLNTLCSNRLEQIHMPNRLRMCRRMPPPGEMEKASTLNRLELQIDILRKLHSEGKITGKAFETAGKNVEHSINRIVVLGIVGWIYQISHLPGDDNTDPVVVLAEEVKSLEKLHKSGRIPKKIYEDFKKRLAQAGISPEKAGLTEEDKKVTDEEKALIEKLIADLAGDDWKVREEATKKLTGMGKTVIPFLEKAQAGEEIEVRIRAEKIISEIKLELAFGKFRKKLDELNKLVLELVK